MTLKSVSPVDGSVVAERSLASESEIEAALTRASASQRAWKEVPIPERTRICLRMAEWCVARADELGSELSWQMGRPVAQSPGEIRRGFDERVRYMCAIAQEALSDMELPGKDNFRRFIRREPLGVVLVVAPWNFPWLTSVNAVVPALLAGNAVILKMAAQTPLVAERYAQAFQAAGLPEGVFQFLHLDHAQVERIIRDTRIGFVAFTGSVPGGHAVQRAASERFMKPDSGITRLTTSTPGRCRSPAKRRSRLQRERSLPSRAASPPGRMRATRRCRAS